MRDNFQFVGVANSNLSGSEVYMREKKQGNITNVGIAISMLTSKEIMIKSLRARHNY